MKLHEAYVSRISGIEIAGFKSIAKRQRIDIRPLTLLAGVNSSGKSSMLQPVLLLKQTLEASFDPGPLRLHDTHVRFTLPKQLLTHVPGEEPAQDLTVHLSVESLSRQSPKPRSVEVRYRARDKGFDLVDTIWCSGDREYRLRPDMPSEELMRQLPKRHWRELQLVEGIIAEPGEDSLVLEVIRQGCFLVPGWRIGRVSAQPLTPFSPTTTITRLLAEIIHLPSHRGNPERAYRSTAPGGPFAGTFDSYAASIILRWQEENDDRVDQIGDDLFRLGLAWKAEARALDATQIELRVSRVPARGRSGRRDMVNIADVGFGVSQVLPVLVALRAAEPGTLVYLEEPELNLHPGAQVGLGRILAEAAQRGAQLVVETHSPLLLLTVQTLIAEGNLNPDLVGLHWFERDEKGVTRVTSRGLDQLGAYGDWPEDFWNVHSALEGRFLDAVEKAVKKEESA